MAKASGGVVPAIGYGARMAFDPLLGEVVLFSGTGVENPNNPYESITWVYNGDTWTNLTSTLGHTVPSARWFFGFDYDPAMGGVILVGGWNVDGLGLNDTWLFTGTWKNITGTTGPLLDNLRHYLAEGGIGGSGAAWDPALHGFLLVDGCDDNSCDYSQEYTWLLNSTGWHTIDYGPGYLADGTFLDEPGMAYNPSTGTWSCSADGTSTPYPYTNYTYTYSGGTEFADNWVNITGMDGGCALGCTPQGRSDIAITWDAQLGGVFLTSRVQRHLRRVQRQLGVPRRTLACDQPRSPGLLRPARGARPRCEFHRHRCVPGRRFLLLPRKLRRARVGL